jgi:hypothetical protein
MMILLPIITRPQKNPLRNFKGFGVFRVKAHEHSLMHHKSTSTLLITAALFLGSPLFAQHDAHHGSAPKAAAAANAGTLLKVTEKDAAWAAKARATYPLEVCLTSDEKLGSMGDSPQYIYRASGQPDRLVVFCCEGCEDDFKAAPAKYIAKLDAAAQAKSGGKAGGKKAKKKQSNQ